jgi:acyl-CoA synthetase (NDP forming)
LVVKECAEKGVKGAILFTAGYRETGTREGRDLEAQLVRVARSSGMRLIGPNCMGLYSPKTGLSIFPGLSSRPGPVGIISHSGSLTNILGRVGSSKGLYFSKVVSLGNECDLTCTDFLTYLGQDSETRMIGAYIEGIKDGTAFLDSLKRVSRKKPVILWKAGLTREGARAAASHTGALAISTDLWRAAVRQGGAVPVTGFTAWMDALMGFSLLTSSFPSTGFGDRTAIISGPGGLAVSAADACEASGLRMARLESETLSRLAQIIDPFGTSLRNPIDIGLTGAINVETCARAVRIAAADSGVDVLVVIGTGITKTDNEKCAAAMKHICTEYSKPVLMVTLPGFGIEHADRFFEYHIPVFESVERAVRTYAQVLRYRQRHF